MVVWACRSQRGGFGRLGFLLIFGLGLGFADWVFYLFFTWAWVLPVGFDRVLPVGFRFTAWWWLTAWWLETG